VVERVLFAGAMAISFDVSCYTRTVDEGMLRLSHSEVGFSCLTLSVPMSRVDEGPLMLDRDRQMRTGLPFVS
jgi:hypothetical protein